ncbi:unnamed protein product [Microthlaspi erraticum]|uniref:MATH domain-containing protein n=1 Tax=Microthlaspi erraticum TaxID=1685480 RepID=A0A6D2J6U2_9BRAS|nr:unnamed protein product [Microthlaspi erraticum]
MEDDQDQTCFTFEIDNFSEKEAVISSPTFSSGGCEWFVRVHPKGSIVDDHLSLFLHVANSESLRLGWRRRASSYWFLFYVSFLIFNFAPSSLSALLLLM